MHGFERRANKRYVIDGLLMDIGGVTHETVDISTRAVAIVRQKDVDYKNLEGPVRFKCKAAALNKPVSTVKYMYERKTTVVLEYVILEYKIETDVWESILSRHDVRADQMPFVDVFG